jgi:hypothetical protein
MNKRRLYIYLALGVMLISFFFWSAWTPRLGWCPEAIFRLSSDSRLPKWFTLPPGYERKDLTVEISNYAPPFGGPNFKAVLKGPAPKYQELDKKLGRTRLHPVMALKRNKFGGVDPDVYPMVTVQTIDGVTEILEHRKADDILYVSDDPELRRQLIHIKE